MLVYDDVVIGHEIEFHFLKRGLENMEKCIYVTHGQVKHIEKEMRQHGMDVDNFKKQHLLRVCQIPNPLEGSVEILDNVNAILKSILPNPELPFRIVGRLIPDVGIEEAMSIQAYLERIFHNGIFERLNGSVLCTYDISQIRANDGWKHWLHDLQMNHHTYILSLNGKNTVSINQN